MHITTVRMKDGRVFCGVLWVWRPAEGWFQLAAVDETGCPDQIWLRDVASAVTENERVSVSRVGDDEDEITRPTSSSFSTATSRRAP